jgi:hypothetical protein
VVVGGGGGGEGGGGGDGGSGSGGDGGGGVAGVGWEGGVAGVVAVVAVVGGGGEGSTHVVHNHWDSALASQHSYTVPSAILSAQMEGLMPPSKNDWQDTPEHHF